jgi:fused-like protein
MLKVENGKNYIESISDITKLIGLLAKITFNKKLGIEMVYIRSFLPLLPSLITCLSASTSSQYQTLTINMLRTIGIFANNASVHHLRSFSFYKDIIEIKFIPDCVSIMKVYQPHINVLKLLVQVLSAFMHPVYGDIECFPWKRSNSYGVVEYKECSTMLDCVRQSIINSLLEVDWMNGFEKVLEVEDESGVLPKISVERIILQAIRQSK